MKAVRGAGYCLRARVKAEFMSLRHLRITKISAVRYMYFIVKFGTIYALKGTNHAMP